MSGYLRFLYEDLLDCESANEWEDVIKPAWNKFKTIRSYYSELSLRKCEKWPQMSNDELWDLYSASRVSDLMLLRYQSGNVDESNYRGPHIELNEYTEFFEYIGFKEYKVTGYHPFYCEIVEVIESDDISEVLIENVIWPALTLNNMVFSRAGVVVKAPSSILKKGIADNSTLYWSFWRKYRKTCDLSDGWGSNSQWRTDLRRDYDLGDIYAYNIDSANAEIPVNLNLPIKEDDESMAGMPILDRIDFLKNRCHVKTKANDSDYWPYDDYFEEKKR